MALIAYWQQTSEVLAVYGSFMMAIVMWGALELSYFKGWLTGPNKAPCPPKLSHWQRFKAGVRTSLHHEIAVIFSASALIGIALISSQVIGTATFILLWLMRWSAKLNLFFGVRNFNCEMLPHPMRYLETYARRARPTAFLLVSGQCVSGRPSNVHGSRQRNAGHVTAVGNHRACVSCCPGFRSANLASGSGAVQRDLDSGPDPRKFA
jgi:putative photosynthetic complex assembly protein 2